MGVVSRVWGWWSSDMAIDLGTAQTLVWVRGRGVVVNEPSVVAVESATKRMVAVGHEAKRMVGRTPGHVAAIRPMREGVIADFELVERMLRAFMGLAREGRGWGRPRVVIGVPSRVTPVERRAVRESAELAGAREVVLIEEPVAAALGAGLPIEEPSGNMVVDVGGGTTDVALISLGGIVYSASVKVAGDQLDAAIVSYLKREYSLLIGDQMAERVKVAMGSAVPLPERMAMVVKGRDVLSGIPRSVSVDDAEIRGVVREAWAPMVEAIRAALEQTPPELAGDIVDRGMVLTGGGSLLRGLDVWLREETGLPMVTVDEPLAAVVMGLGVALESWADGGMVAGQ